MLFWGSLWLTVGPDLRVLQVWKAGPERLSCPRGRS